MVVTLKKVAELADTSISAVSVVLGRRRPSNIGVGAATRDRIYAAAKELGYQPNLQARALRGGRTQTVGLIWSMGGPHEPISMVRQIGRLLFKRGYIVYPVEQMGDSKITEKTLADMAMRRVDAVIINGGNKTLNAQVLEQLVSFPAAVIVADQPIPNCQFDVIVHDRLSAFRDSADHFVNTGRRRPAVLCNRVPNQPKIDAFIDQLRQRGMKPGPEAVVEVPYYSDDVNLVEHFAECIESHLTCHGPIDALQCQNDPAAAGAIIALRRHKLKVPEDVAVIGFNNVDMAACMTPPLASVERHDDRVAQLIEQMIFARLDQPDRSVQVEQVSMAFVHRESAG